MRIGDRVRGPDGVIGTVVCLPETRESTTAYSRGWYEVLRTGVLIENEEFGRLHYESLAGVVVVSDDIPR